MIGGCVGTQLMMRAFGCALFALCTATFLGASGLAQAQARDFRLVTFDQLPAEARNTIALIKKGGPFPYKKDGTVFGNFEKRLPLHERGYYHEFTVPTPGSRDRGARRIVTGKAGEYFYTDDHYKSFRRVRE
jgi:ribonuclease T1